MVQLPLQILLSVMILVPKPFINEKDALIPFLLRNILFCLKFPVLFITVRLITARHRKTPQDTARHRKTPQDTHKTPQDNARQLQDTARDLKKDACKVIIDIQGYGGGGGGGGGGVVTKVFGRTFLLHFCTNCEKTKLVTSQKKMFTIFFQVLFFHNSRKNAIKMLSQKFL